MKKTFFAAVLSLCIMNMNMIPSFASELVFTDVKKEFWGHDSIQWAIKNKVVEGYADRTFKPKRAVSQSEFLAMIIRTYQPDDFIPDSNSERWDTPYLTYAKKLNWKVETSDQILTRGIAAKYIANVTGKNYSMDMSIQYLLDLELANGKNTRTVEGFKKNDTITRVEAVALLERLRQSNDILYSIGMNEELYNREEHVIVYEDPDFNFSLTLPKSWENKFKLETVSGSLGDNIQFINKATETGILFTISVWSSEKWEKKKEEIQGQIPAIKLGEYRDKSYIFHTSTDVQYDPDDKTSSEDYLMMFEDVQKIRASFEVIK